MAKRLSRQEIERRLVELERSPRPEGLRPGALCYSPAAPYGTGHWVYVCPACGKRTAYLPEGEADRRGGAAPAREASDGERRVPWDFLWPESTQKLQSALSLARRLPKSSGVSLDESALCVFCRPEATDFVPWLEVRLPGEEPRRLPLSLEDARALRAFLRGADRYPGENDAESALGDAVGRLRRLLLGDSHQDGNGDE